MKFHTTLLFFLILVSAKAQLNAPADSSVIEEKYTWDLKDLYPNDSLWEEDFTWVQANIEGYLTFKNKLANALFLIYDFIKFDERIKTKIDKLTMYAYLSRDSHLSDSRFTSMYGRISRLDAQAKSYKSFFENEITRIPFEQLGDYITNDEKMTPYDQYIYSILRNNTHSLLDVKEEVVSLTKPLTQVAFNSFIKLSNLDFSDLYDAVEDTIGYREHCNTMAALFEGNITINKFYARIRNFNSTIEANLFPEDIPIDVYDNLINTVNRNISPIQKWIGIKCKILNKDKLSYDDVFANSIFPEIDKVYTFDDGIKILKTSIAVLGKEYNDIVDIALNSRWIDVYPNANKRQDQYTGTILGQHSYIFLNWKNQFQNLYALQHEMGHLVNIEFTRKNQPLIYTQIPTFNSEIASKVNELLLLDYLTTHAETKTEQLYFIEKYIVQIISSFYNQTLLAEFEKRVYEISEKGQPLTPEILNNECTYLYKAYFGEQFIINNKVKYLWSMVPHYYYNFYIYSYPMGLAIAYKFVQNIHDKGEPAVNEYLTFLKSGGFDYPANILKRSGVIINSKETILPLINKLNQLIDLFDTLYRSK